MEDSKTIPTAILKKIRPHLFVNQSITTGRRLDGRGRDEARKPQLNTNIFSTCDGSSSLRLGSSFIISGVNLEIVTFAKPSLEIVVECAKTCVLPSANHETAKASTAVHQILTGAVVLNDLVIDEQHSWKVRLTNTLVESDGCIASHIVLSALGALLTTFIPKVEKRRGVWTVVEQAYKKIRVASLPILLDIACTSNGMTVVDPTSEEITSSSYSGTYFSHTPLDDDTLEKREWTIFNFLSSELNGNIEGFLPGKVNIKALEETAKAWYNLLRPLA